MTYECDTCCIRWLPYQCRNGACPSCGSGCKRTNEPSTEGAADLHKALKLVQASSDLHDRFERFYAHRCAVQATEEIDALEMWASLPTVDRDV